MIETELKIINSGKCEESITNSKLLENSLCTERENGELLQGEFINNCMINLIAKNCVISNSLNNDLFNQQRNAGGPVVNSDGVIFNNK